MAKIQFNAATEVFVSAVQEWSDRCKDGVAAAFRYQARNVAQALIDGYEADGRKSWNHATPPNNKEQGEAAVKRDIRRAIFPLTHQGFASKEIRNRVRRVVEANDVKLLQLFVQNGVFGSQRKSMQVIFPGGIRQAHQSCRKSRGRVLKKVPSFAVIGKKPLTEYLKDAIKAVGQAKGGWVASLLGLGGRAPSRWIARHSKAGTFTDSSTDEETRITMINRSKWASYRSEAQRIVNEVMRNRAGIIKADLAFLIERGWKRGGRGQIIKR